MEAPLAFAGYSADDFHPRVGLIGTGPRERNVTKLRTSQSGVIPLSPLDYPEAFSWTPLVFPFENKNFEIRFMPDGQMLASLQQVVERVPIVAGQIERIDGTALSMDGPNPPLQVRIGKGSVWYASTRVPSSFQGFKKGGFNCEHHPELLFRAANRAIVQGEDYPLLAIKASRFDCGSVVLLVTACHLVVDARSVYELVRTWSMCYCGVPDAPLVNESRHLFSFDAELSGRSATIHSLIANMPHSTQPVRRTKLLRASIPVHALAAFKASLNAELAPGWVSSDDIAVCLAWRACARARGLALADTSTLTRIIDVRKLNQLPSTAFGNGVFIVSVGPLPVATLLQAPISEICRRLREAVVAFDAGLVRDVLTACSKLTMTHHPPGGSPRASDNFSSSYASFAPDAIDFQNSPALTVTRACYAEGSIAPQPIANKVYAIKVAVHSAHASAFMKDADFLGAGFTIKP